LPVSLLVSIASRFRVIRVTSRASISLSFSLRRSEDLFSLRQPYDGWVAFHCLALYREIDRRDKKIFDLYSDVKKRRFRRSGYCLHRINLQSPRDAGASKCFACSFSLVACVFRSCSIRASPLNYYRKNGNIVYCSEYHLRHFLITASLILTFPLKIFFQ